MIKHLLNFLLFFKSILYLIFKNCKHFLNLSCYKLRFIINNALITKNFTIIL